MLDKLTYIIFILCISPAITIAGEFEYSGQIGYESRVFTENPKFDGQLDGVQNSVFAEPEFSWYSSDENTEINFVPYFRLDSRDDERTHFDVRELYIRQYIDDWTILAGINRVFWGVTESRHLVNIINQTDQVENTDGEDYLGQAMLNIANQTDYGLVSLYILPGFRESTFSGVNGRFRGGTLVDTDNANYESGAGEYHTDIALRYSHVLGDFDIGASYFYGTSREAILQLSNNKFVPFYSIINQAGLDLQYTKEQWLLKFEGIVREGQGETFTATTSGVEYTIYQILKSNMDLGFLLEYSHDDRDQINAPFSSLENDIFVGTRLTFNDSQDTAILAGGSIDTNDGSSAIRLEAERRIGDSWKMEIEGQSYFNVDDSNGLSALEKDDFVVFRIAKYF